MLYLFDQKYSKKDYHNLKEPISVLIYFKTQFIPVTAKMNFQQSLYATLVFKKYYYRCCTFFLLLNISVETGKFRVRLID